MAVSSVTCWAHLLRFGEAGVLVVDSFVKWNIFVAVMAVSSLFRDPRDVGQSFRCQVG